MIRPAHLSDLPSLLSIEHCCFPLGIAFGPAQIRRLLRNERANCIVATGADSATLAGWAVGLVRQHRNAKSGRIYTLAIDPDFQGRGVGKLLIHHLLDWFRKQRVRHIYLEVRAENQRAIALYEKLGFKKVRDLPDYYEDGAAGISMRMTL